MLQLAPRVLAASEALHYVVGSVEGVTEQLTGIEIPFPGDDTFYFASVDNKPLEEIMSVGNDHQVVPSIH